MEAVVLGNVTLDVICLTVNEVPRYESLSFDRALVSPGGCGSNTAIGLSALGVRTGLIARMGDDAAADVLVSTWERFGLDHSRVQRVPGVTTGVSVGLIDSDAQPRFIHTSGANATLTPDAIRLEQLVEQGAEILHIAGFFVLPGLLTDKLAGVLEQARCLGIKTSLDVVRSPRMKRPEFLWPNLPHLDYFQCNLVEAEKLTGESQVEVASKVLRDRGARVVVVKLGEAGCFVDGPQYCGRIPGQRAAVVDTTGAGDSFAAGFIAGLLRGEDLVGACTSGNQAGALAVGQMGAVAHWQSRVRQ